MVNSVRCLDQFFAAVHPPPHPNQGSSRQPLPTPSLLEMSAKKDNSMILVGTGPLKIQVYERQLFPLSSNNHWHLNVSDSELRPGPGTIVEVGSKKDPLGPDQKRGQHMTFTWWSGVLTTPHPLPPY